MEHCFLENRKDLSLDNSFDASLNLMVTYKPARTGECPSSGRKCLALSFMMSCTRNKVGLTMFTVDRYLDAYLNGFELFGAILHVGVALDLLHVHISGISGFLVVMAE